MLTLLGVGGEWGVGGVEGLSKKEREKTEGHGEQYSDCHREQVGRSEKRVWGEKCGWKAIDLR